MTAPLSGRRAQAARNDELILEAARAVFVADPGAPVAAVAQRAEVGYLALLLQPLRAPAGAPLPGPAPTWPEISRRWDP